MNSGRNMKINVLKQIVMNGKTLSIDQLKRKLLIDNNNDLLKFLTKVMLKEFESLNNSKHPNNYEWLYYPMSYIVEIISNDESVHTLEVLRSIEVIKEIIDIEQNGKMKNISKDFKMFYSKMSDIINPLIKILYKKTRKLRSDEQIQISNTNLYKFTSKLIFEFKNFDYIFQLYKTYPDLINCTSEENIPIIFNIIKAQIKNIKKHNHKNSSSVKRVLYFDRIINFIINSNEFYLTDSQLHMILNYLKNELNIIKESCTNNDEVIYFIKNLIRDLKSKSKITTMPKNIKELYMKYNISEITGDYFNKGLIKNDELLDYTDKMVITMDSSNYVRIFDDAISCEILPNGNYLIGIYIADVASLIPYQSDLDLLCYNRAESIYLNDKVIDMLPLDIAYHCSLNTSSDKRAIAYMFEFTKDMELYDFKVRNVMIKIRENLTFRSGQKLYSSNYKADNEIGKMLKNLINFNQIFTSSNFYDQNYHLFKEQKRKLEAVHEHHGDNDCSFLINSLMILVNRSMAKYFCENGYPFLYRVNNSNIDPLIISQMKEAIHNQILPTEIISQIDNVYSRSKYSGFNTGHNGLKLDHYCHTTNPIRNYASLFTQRMVIDEFIKGGISDKLFYEYEKQIPIIATNLNEQIDLDDNFKLEYNRIRKKFTRK